MGFLERSLGPGAFEGGASGAAEAAIFFRLTRFFVNNFDLPHENLRILANPEVRFASDHVTRPRGHPLSWNIRPKSCEALICRGRGGGFEPIQFNSIQSAPARVSLRDGREGGERPRFLRNPSIIRRPAASPSGRLITRWNMDPSAAVVRATFRQPCSWLRL